MCSRTRDESQWKCESQFRMIANNMSRFANYITSRCSMIRNGNYAWKHRMEKVLTNLKGALESELLLNYRKKTQFE